MLLSSVDLSERYKTEEHSFTGTAEQKAAATVVRFHKPTQIDFLPKSILTDFPRLIGIRIENCKTFTIIGDSLFTEDFGAIQYLSLYLNKIAMIEANAFNQLSSKLKWINLGYNQLSSLPNQIFKNNQELIAIWFHLNKINSITPDFFKNLNKLQFVEIGNNQCIDEKFGCWPGSCLLSHSELDSDFSTCYSNCLSEVERASKSGKLDNLDPKQIEKNLDWIVSSGHAAALVEKGYSRPEIDQTKIANCGNETQHGVFLDDD
jgi:hypothetical protein